MLRDDGMSCLVECDSFLLLRIHHAVLFFQAADDPVKRLVEICHLDHLLALARGKERGFVNQVGKIGTCEPRGPSGEFSQVDLRSEDNALDVNFENLLPSLEVRPVQCDVAVKATGAKQGGVQYLGSVCGGHDDDAFVAIKTVHLDQKLVQCLFALLVAADRIQCSRLSECVKLINEDDAGGFGFGLLKEIADPCCTHTNEHLDEVGAAHAEEWHAGFACHGLCQ